MKNNNNLIKILLNSLLILFTLTGPVLPSAPLNLSPDLTVTTGAINSATIQRNHHNLVIYGSSEEFETPPDKVLLTDFRRDLVWAARNLAASGVSITAPAAELEKFTGVKEYWEKVGTTGTGQFHDYEQQTTKMITEPLAVNQAVKEGDILTWQDLSFTVLDTPGYTRGAVSYFVNLSGNKIGFTGDLIYGDGQLLDLYSLQDSISGTRIRGYHGYAGRISALLESLRKVRDQQCDFLVPARGPVIQNPAEAINKLINRLQEAYANYLAVNAGRWYFKEDYDILAQRALGSADQVDWMPWAETIQDQPPGWIKVISNSRLIVSRDNSAFLVDCGSEGVFGEVKKLQEEGTVTTVDGLFITHYHDDHTDFAARAAEKFDCPVYATKWSSDILADPRAYRMPALTPNPIPGIQSVPDSYKMQWKEFIFEFFYFPGQAIYHDAMLVTRDGGEKIFFIGDSFSPSGIDDYCLLNRNLLQEGMGYFYCLDFLKKLPTGTLLINEHIVQPFAFSPYQLDLMINTLEKRREVLSQLFPWDDPNYGIDEQWVRFQPYNIEIKRGGSGEVSIRIFNHSPAPRTFRIRINAPEGVQVTPGQREVLVASHQEKSSSFTISSAGSGSSDRAVHVLTADISGDDLDLREWCEGLVTIKP